MNRLQAIIFIVASMIFCVPKGFSQEIQEFGPGVHQDLDHRIETRRVCVPSPKKDVSYDFKKSFEANVNAAIKRERVAFGQKNIGDYVHPAYYSDPVDYAHKIITALRKAYANAYGIKVVDIPLDASVVTAAQNHSCKMISCNQFTHQSSCTGSPKSRISEQVGSWGSCLTGYSENIAINTSKSIEGAMEWAIFGMMYDDLACCNNGHRENFLKCTYDNSWRMGFGYKKGKYSFGSSRSYDTWFMTWDYAKKGRSSSCKWDKSNGKKVCKPATVAVQNLKVNGQSDCTSLKATWTATNTGQIQNFEVYQSTDGKGYKRVTTVKPGAAKSFSSNFSTSGKESKVFVKAVTKEGSFYASEVFVFNVADCKPSANPTDPTPDQPGEDVTDNNPPAPPKPEPKPDPKPDPAQIIIAPNPASYYIRLTNVPYGTPYRITSMKGRTVRFGYYRRNIYVGRLAPGTYVVTADGKTGRFIKQ
ncbi:hypothetical protein KUV50_09875 [Membranicola marinus]|uniref:Cysteine-rich secretory protein family protein n=1 Tax=Membranihabitans marinus TaxID=1227546 RepID=A0A953L946_9BACT|nr:hypothetical protein [Membranihabitans marinus]MBY5958440.1 hypothetical protein [Membranihabitans marinus]